MWERRRTERGAAEDRCSPEEMLAFKSRFKHQLLILWLFWGCCFFERRNYSAQQVQKKEKKLTLTFVFRGGLVFLSTGDLTVMICFLF